MNSLVVLVAVVYIAGSVQGATFFNSIETHVNEYGSKEKFCTYKGMQYGIGSRFMDAEDCVKCTCNKSGLGCASTAHTVHVEGESQCINVVDKCRNKWVMKDDVTKKCPRRLQPKSISMVGK